MQGQPDGYKSDRPIGGASPKRVRESPLQRKPDDLVFSSVDLALKILRTVLEEGAISLEGFWDTVALHVLARDSSGGLITVIDVATGNDVGRKMVWQEDQTGLACLLWTLRDERIAERKGLVEFAVNHIELRTTSGVVPVNGGRLRNQMRQYNARLRSAMGGSVRLLIERIEPLIKTP